MHSGYRLGFGTIPCELALVRPEVDLCVALEMINRVQYHLSDDDVCVGLLPHPPFQGIGVFLAFLHLPSKIGNGLNDFSLVDMESGLNIGHHPPAKRPRPKDNYKNVARTILQQMGW